jgi:hypothetical protein
MGGTPAQQRLAFGAQRAQGLQRASRGLMGQDTRTPSEQLQMAMAQLDMSNPDDLRKIAQIQQATGDLAGAAQTAARIKQMQQEEASIKQTLTTRQSLISRLSQDKKYENVIPLVASGVFDNNFAELLPMLAPEEKGVELSKPFAGEYNGTPIMLSVKSESGKDDVVVNALTQEPAPAGTTIDKNGTSVEVNLGQEGRSAFIEKLGEKRAGSLIDQFEDAKAASLKSDVIDTQWDTISQGAGILTGTGAEIKLGAGKLLKAVGLISGEGEELISNTETFIANAGNLVAEVIKAFGAGTGLSDADREFAKGIVGGTITLDGESLKRLIKLQARATRKKIQEHNKQIAKLGGEIAQFGMTVDVPEFAWAYDQQPKVDAEIQSLIDLYTPNSGASR